MSNGETLDTYNRSASEFAEYFRGIGSRVNDIEKALGLAGKADGSATVLELGCGDGRDAEAIIERVGSYTGIDYSDELIKLAREKLPESDLRTEDIQNFDYPTNNYDVVYAFASLLHIDKDGNERLVQDVARSLKPGGIFYVSLKKADEYVRRRQEDKFGARDFYYYNPAIFAEICEPFLDVVMIEEETIGHTDWFEIALSKR